MDTHRLTPVYIASRNAFSIYNSELSRFLSLALKVTGACDKKCPFCCEPNRIQPVYNVETWLAILNRIKLHGTLKLCITGGEPLLYTDLPKLLALARDLGLSPLLSTANGYLLIKRAESILHNITGIRFSLHGIGETHDRIVQSRAAFEWVCRAVDLTVKERIPTFVATVVHRENANQIHQIAQWCIEHSVIKYYLYNVLSSGLGDEFINSNHALRHNEFISLVTSVEAQFADTALEIRHLDYASIAECVLVYGDGRVVVDPYPHSPNHQLEIGNLLREDLDVIWQRLNDMHPQGIGYGHHLANS